MTDDIKDRWTDTDEQRLNPPPHQYKVSFFIKCLFLVIFALGLFGYSYMIIERRISQTRSLNHNQMAAVKLVPVPTPKLTAYDVNADQKIDLASLLHGWTLLNIWATWCPPCKEEMPSLELLQQTLSGKLNIIAVSVDDSLDAVKDFIALNHPKFKILWDEEKTFSLKFGIKKYPETFLIAPDGQITTQFSGPRDWASKAAIDYLLDATK